MVVSDNSSEWMIVSDNSERVDGRWYMVVSNNSELANAGS
jgi:hypothetical protein